MIDIKNLTFVHLYDKHEGNFPILKIKYDEKELTIDYTHPEFLDILMQVWEEYQKNPNIIVFGKFDEEKVKKCMEIGNYQPNITHTQESSLLNSEKDINKIKKYESYLKEIIKQIIELNGESEISFGNIHGHKNKFSIPCTINGKETFITFTCYFEKGALLFKTSYINNSVMPISGQIEFRNDRVFITWKSSDNELYGTIIHSIEEENEQTIQNSRYSSKKNIDIVIPDKEQKLVNFYLELSGLTIPEKLIKTTENTYLFLTIDYEEKNTCTLTYGHITIYPNRVIINSKKEYGVSSLQQYLFIPIEGYAIDTTIVPVDKNHILIEHFFPKTKNSTCVQKQLEGTYSYELVETTSQDLSKPFEYEKYSLADEINDLDDINKAERKPKTKQIVTRR
ncbi:MAG: hypothetical protein HFH46_02220 [Bacilli bacterium]|nr:hypothetical protein [Bacilli bacterium]